MFSGGLYGLVNRISDSSALEVIGRAGLDFVMIDCEHAPYSWHDVQARIIAAQSVGLRAHVRVPSTQPQGIGLALDLGANGIHVPHVRSLRDAEAACDAAFYSPKGKRGFALSHRGADYGKLSAAELIAAQNETLIIAHVEDPEAVQAIDEISACQRLDILFVAPFDLSYGLGVPGDLGADVLWDALRRVAEAAGRARKVCGTYVTDYQRLPELREMGYRYFLVGGDLGLLARAAADVAKTVGGSARVVA